MYEFDRLNYIAIQILEQAGNPNPTQKQIDKIEDLLATLTNQSPYEPPLAYQSVAY